MHLVGGKGGVGKTTIAAALASHLATDGAPTLLVSTDPAHSAGDALDHRLRDEPTVVRGALEAVEIDAEAAADAYVERVRRDSHRLVSPEVRATVDRHLDLARQGAGTLESALVDRLVDLLDGCPDRWRRVVVDTAPTGHTLRLLAMPELLTGWVEGLVSQRERARGVERLASRLAGDDAPPSDPVLVRLRDQHERLTRLRRRLRDDAVVHLVALPERLPVAETRRAATSLDQAGLTLGAVVVNRVLPDDADGDYVAARRAQQQVHLAELDGQFADRPRPRVPQLPGDVADPAALAEVGRHLDVLHS